MQCNRHAYKRNYTNISTRTNSGTKIIPGNFPVKCIHTIKPHKKLKKKRVADATATKFISK